MTQEEKSLLLKDLCARLPYDLYVRWCDGTIENISQKLHCLPIAVIENAKMFLRPMSSMTEEEEKEQDRTPMKYLGDFYRSKHLDHYNLIEKGLALEAKEGMYESQA